ncbi:MAG TPA: hypothetical protein VHC69_07360, partial [Polyangiaceae bacterium]|nr:hypothetical protein [Polyangiaceae bacterium]
TDGWTDELNHRITGAATGGVSVVANGDVTGAINANTVVKIQGRSVNAVAPSNGQVLGWDQADGYWKPVNQTGGAGSQTLSQTLALGNTTDGYNIVVSNGDDIQGADGYDLSLITASMSNASAGNVAVIGGQSIDSGTGNINYGAVVTVGGGTYPGGETSGSGGSITISAGSGNIAGSTGGSVTITANSGPGGDGSIDIAAVGGVDIRSISDALYFLTDNTQRLSIGHDGTINIPGFGGGGTRLLQTDNLGNVSPLNATQQGQVLLSTDGSTFSAVLPLTSDNGWLVNESGLLLYI